MLYLLVLAALLSGISDTSRSLVQEFRERD